MKTLVSILALALAGASAGATEFHVSPLGNDANAGSKSRMLKSISAAARLAKPGDTITVHAGVYREQVSPPRGGDSDRKRILYRAAPGEQVAIKGSEVVRGWEKVQNDTWKVTLPNRFFGEFNPYRDLIRGDWFTHNGRHHHSGAVYLNGHWLTEAAKLEEVLGAPAKTPLWFTDDPNAQFLMNIAWIRPARGGDGTEGRIPADRYAGQGGVKTGDSKEGGKCIGWIKDGDWVQYEQVDFGEGTELLELRAASATNGGLVEFHLNAPAGELLGTCSVPGTGDWQSWSTVSAKIKPTRGKQTLCLVFRAPPSDSTTTTIWAQFPGVNPNEQLVEINVRQTVFYPERPGINYLTVRGFTLEHAATPWAPPTAEQMGLIGTHWSKGWIIEDNVIRYSRCVGVALGKYGDQWDNRAESAEGYVGTLTRALTNGWNKATVGSHVVRNNHVSHCEQTGVVGSLGCSFSTVTGNEIHDIHVLRLFTGAEQAGIKFHGAIDVQISHNRIHHCGSFGIWLDWMAQGARVTGNLLHDNINEDLFMEVDHGPFVVDNNLFLSKKTQLIDSQGGAYAHNLVAGKLNSIDFDERLTPYHRAHSTEVAGLTNNPSGDVRYYNNLFVERGDLSPYDKPRLPVQMAGNVFLKGSKPCVRETAPLLKPDFDPQIKLVQRPDGVYLELKLDKAWRTEQKRELVTTEMLGRAMIPDLPFENADGSPLRVNTDYFSKKRSTRNPFPGPFEAPRSGLQVFKVWPRGR